MSFDGVTLRHVVADLQSTITHGRINKIYQLNPSDFLLVIRTNQTHRVLISIHPQYSRIHRTFEDFDTPAHPPMFCMFLRKHLEGGTIEKISQNNNDRVVTITLKTRNELGDLTHKHLIVETLGKDANMIVTDAHNSILDALKKTGPFDGHDRTITPTAKYVYPIDQRINPFDKAALEKFFKSFNPASSRKLIHDFSGVSPLLIQEFFHRLSRQDETPYAVFNALINETQYTLVSCPKRAYAVYQLSHLNNNLETHPSVVDLLDVFHHAVEHTQQLKQSAKDIVDFVDRQIDKQKDKLEKLVKQLHRDETMDAYRLYGELLQANLHAVKKGDRNVELLNYYDNQHITIPLDIKKTPIENSLHYFNQYKKIKRSVPFIKKQYRLAQTELNYFRLIESQLEHARLSEIESIREELENHRYLKPKKRTTKRKSAPFITVKDSLGIEILVGKNNEQNNIITHQIAHYQHVFFHVKEAPGAHVVVKHPLPLSETTIRTAAQLAAYYSKMRLSSSVPVDYTSIKHVKKIPGKHGCFVRYEGHKTIYIDPDENFVNALVNPTKK